MPSGWKLEHSYSALPSVFYSGISPVSVASPNLVTLNLALAHSLGLNPDLLKTRAASIFSGNALPDGAHPIAQAYAGHQYGHFTMLGDGRAVLLGEQMDPQGNRWDIQLKGSGRTSYSRRGDGRAALGPMLREYLISEAMAALGIPSTRSLAVVTTGESVFRETPLPGAVLTRVAASHIRVGTFEFAATQGPEFVKALADYAIQRHFIDAKDSEQQYTFLLKRVMSKQADLIAAWMQVGFVHGVMNTDNMAISGETIDYGPCAFMDRYDPETVFSSIDRDGRYAFGRQPAIAQWNLARFAETLLPLLSPDEEKAVEIARNALENFAHELSERLNQKMREKLGLFESRPEDATLIQGLLRWMFENQRDYTNTFRSLSLDLETTDPSLDEWVARLEHRRSLERRTSQQVNALMKRSNPNLIPRNHHVEAALESALKTGDLTAFHKLLIALQNPFEERAEQLPYLDPPPTNSEPYRTFCGT